MPQNSYGAYWTTAPWYDFDNIIGFDPEVGVKITTLKGIKLYPNPVASSLYIDLDTNKEIHHISIYNTSGQIIQKEVIANSYIQLDVSNYPAGTYIVQASGTNNQLYNLGKFAKE